MSEEIEIWKDIPGFEGLYKVSSMGRVKSLPKQWVAGRFGNAKQGHSGKIMATPTDSSNGYTKISLYKDRKKHQFNGHILVALAFLPNPENKPEVNHKNTIRHDNRLENLERNTYSENNKHAYTHGHNPKGQDKPNTILTNVHVRTIRDLWGTGKYQQRELGKLFSIHQHTVWSIVNRETWKHIA